MVYTNYLGRNDLPRGLRNNNPGNLEATAIPWRGKKTPNTDGRFEQFIELRYGIRALMRDIINDIEQDKLDTITKLITAYAPPSENNTQAYINAVSNATGIGANEKLYPRNTSTLVGLVKAIVSHENGSAHASKVSMQDINDAISILDQSLSETVVITAQKKKTSILTVIALTTVAFLGFNYFKNKK
jgi:hypothetical protein